MKEQLNQQELDERVAVLKRFRSLLEAQRNKFREYLSVLEGQQGKIEADNGDDILAHTELEQQIIKNIASLQHVIVPMQHLYNAVSSGPEVSKDDHEHITKMQSDLADLQQKVLAQNEKNRQLLKNHIQQVRTQLDTMKINNPYRCKQSVYAEHAARGSIVQIDA